jgi:hypothetical protein
LGEQADRIEYTKVFLLQAVASKLVEGLGVTSERKG